MLCSDECAPFLPTFAPKAMAAAASASDAKPSDVVSSGKPRPDGSAAEMTR